MAATAPQAGLDAELRAVCTDRGNASRLAVLVGHRYRYVHEWNDWIYWNGNRWELDVQNRLQADCELVTHHWFQAAVAAEAGDRKRLMSHAVKSCSLPAINAMIKLLRSERDKDGNSITITADQLDRNPWLTTFQNGTLDSRTRQLEKSRPSSLITKQINLWYDPHAKAPRWEQFVKEVLQDAETVDFVQRAVGHSLTGDTREQCMFILHGSGANGKSRFLETLLALFGEYGLRTAADTLLAKRSDAATYDVADLRGARLVVASETEDGKRLAEARIKELTGGDTIKARQIYGKPFSFRPEAKLWLSTNHRPRIRGTDDAIWRRVRLIPFPRQFKGEAADKDLEQKLLAELPGILAWAVRGVALWLEYGLEPPATVQQATADYRGGEDTLGEFLADCCEDDPEARTPIKSIYAAYVSWCEQNGERPRTKRSVGMALQEKGYAEVRTGAARCRAGLRLLGGDA